MTRNSVPCGAGLASVGVDQHEGEKLDFFVMLTRVQAVEVRSAVHAEQHSFTVQDEGIGPVTQRGFDDARVAAAPVVTVAGPQPHGLALPLNDQPVAVVLDFVKPIRPVGTLVPRVGMQGSNAGLRMRDK